MSRRKRIGQLLEADQADADKLERTVRGMQKDLKSIRGSLTALEDEMKFFSRLAASALKSSPIKFGLMLDPADSPADRKEDQEDFDTDLKETADGLKEQWGIVEQKFASLQAGMAAYKVHIARLA